MNGLGERCGNANLVTLIPTLKLKADYADRFDIGVGDEELATSRMSHAHVDEILNRAPNRHAPYVGASAFATKAGIHASAVVRTRGPTSMWSRRASATGAGCWCPTRPGVQRPGRTRAPRHRVDRDDPRIGRLLDEVKREAMGYAYEGADASFYLLAKRVLGEVPDFFTVERF